jgi:hypothetical protein
MGKVAIALAISLVTASAQAQTRPSTVNMSCGASRQLVFARGAIVLGTGGFTYDRFVRDQTFCDVTEYAQAAYVPSIETPVCFVGYRCKQGPRDWWDE